jgi:hypothetical protein
MTEWLKDSKVTRRRKFVHIFCTSVCYCRMAEELQSAYPHSLSLIESSKNLFSYFNSESPVWSPGKKNSPTVTHVCRKRRLKWGATLPLGDINTEDWSSGIGVGRGANNPTL